ncbi:hypothetical protein CMI37_02325 [Candidatus Pacearchaeota archaeon]|nr:hypothetical protein [Candidatus Pacearchaeota archaeon]
MSTVVRSGDVSIQISDGLQRMLDSVLERAVPSLRPAMERLITEAVEEVRASWPDPRAREKFDRRREVAIGKANAERRSRRSQGQTPIGVTYWDYMDPPYRPEGWRATGKSGKAWRAVFSVEPGPVLVASLHNDARRGGAKYAYMAKAPISAPSSGKPYWRLYALKAIKSREKRAVDAMIKASRDMMEPK